ncbi:hypothetical protein ACOZ4F_07195 [Haloarcula marismortui]|uniref:hypothetical protein n=1 Tax=Haloarcula marismortui TaxID=2238 RepID=UPI0012FF2D82|nr:hypothetical protein [Haloarcula taiwanensis]
MTDYTTISVSKTTKKEIDRAGLELLGLDASKVAYNVILSKMAAEINEGDN